MNPRRTAAIIAAVTMCSVVFAGGDYAQAQKAPTRFCPTFHAISRTQHSDRTNAGFSSLRKAINVESRYARELFNRCVGLVAIGVSKTHGGDAAHDWVIAATVLARDMPAKNESLAIEGVRLVLWAHGANPTNGPHQL